MLRRFLLMLGLILGRLMLYVLRFKVRFTIGCLSVTTRLMSLPLIHGKLKIFDRRLASEVRVRV